MSRRGDVVIALFPFVTGIGGKVRPAVVVQCDRLNRQLQTTILAMVTGNTKLAKTEPSQLLIDPGTPEGASSGLVQRSAVKCENLVTVSQAAIRKTLGHLSDDLRTKLNDCLKATFELP